MIKVKTFTCGLAAMHTMKELNNLDDQVNTFIQANKVTQVISVSDACTSGSGDSIGLIRVLTYEHPL